MSDICRHKVWWLDKMNFKLLFGIGTLAMAAIASTHPFGSNAASMNDMDRNFMTTLARAGLAEIQAGQIAAQQGNRADRRFGRQMVKEHEAASRQLLHLATNRNVVLPDSPAPEDAVAIHRLEKIDRSNFAPAYHHFAVMSHRQAIGLFKQEIAYGRDPAVKAWAEKTLPMIKEHYREARSL